jgi:hypothetical protein
MILCHQKVAEEGRDHDHFAMGKIQNIRGLDDEYKTQGDQSIKATYGNTARE